MKKRQIFLAAYCMSVSAALDGNAVIYAVLSLLMVIIIFWGKFDA